MRPCEPMKQKNDTQKKRTFHEWKMKSKSSWTGLEMASIEMELRVEKASY